jgi:hypothetical protein
MTIDENGGMMMKVWKLQGVPSPKVEKSNRKDNNPKNMVVGRGSVITQATPKFEMKRSTVVEGYDNNEPKDASGIVIPTAQVRIIKKKMTKQI